MREELAEVEGEALVVLAVLAITAVGRLACEGCRARPGLALDVDGYDGGGHPLDDVGEGRGRARRSDRALAVDRAAFRAGPRPIAPRAGEHEGDGAASGPGEIGLSLQFIH